MATGALQLPEIDALHLDPAALRKKYDLERDRRLRPEGNDQYVEVVGEYNHFLDDPWADPSFTRDPIVRDVEVLIVGGG